MANQEQVDLIKQNIDTWNAWRREHPFIYLNLGGAYLVGANLSRGDLGRADLSGADLYSADLSNADLTRANLTGAHLSGANLTGAHLSGANLTGAHLSDANLTGAHLSGAHLDGAIVGETAFIGLDLRTVKGLETLKHHRSSIVDTGTLELSQGNIPRAFLQGVGLSNSLIDYLPSLFATSIQYHSLFLSYSHQDEALAHRLYQGLQNKGVRCWMAPHDLRPGDYHHSRIDEAIHLHERTLLLLSEHAIKSAWIKHEVQIALAREVTQDSTVLFPLRLDEAVMHTNKEWAVRLRESRHIGDFTGWQDEVAYQQAFTKLLQHLKVTQLPVNRSASSLSSESI